MNDNVAGRNVLDLTGTQDGWYYDGGAPDNTSSGSVLGKINRALDLDTDEWVRLFDHGGSVKSIAMWCKPDAVNVTDYLIDLNGTDYITIVNGTVTVNGFAASTEIIYVDGVVAATVTANWHHVVITATAGFVASDLEVGRLLGSGYFNGIVEEVMIFDVILTPIQAKKLHDYKGKESIYGQRHNRIHIANNKTIFGD
jgi:hypothetical protein